MPLPVIVGIPWLAGVIGGAVAGLATWLAKVFTRAVAVRVVIVGAMLAALVIFVGVLEGLIVGIQAVFPSNMTGFLVLCLPPNATACLSAIITLRLAKYAYEWNVRIIQWTLPGMK